MFPPSFDCYPMPTIHPQTRVTRIDDIRNVDPSFHRFRSHQGMLAHMKPGDSLYVRALHGFSNIVLDHSSRTFSGFASPSTSGALHTPRAALFDAVGCRDCRLQSAVIFRPPKVHPVHVVSLCRTCSEHPTSGEYYAVNSLPV